MGRVANALLNDWLHCVSNPLDHCIGTEGCSVCSEQNAAMLSNCRRSVVSVISEVFILLLPFRTTFTSSQWMALRNLCTCHMR